MTKSLNAPTGCNLNGCKDGDNTKKVAVGFKVLLKL